MESWKAAEPIIQYYMFSMLPIGQDNGKLITNNHSMAISSHWESMLLKTLNGLACNIFVHDSAFHGRSFEMFAQVCDHFSPSCTSSIIMHLSSVCEMEIS